MNVEDDSAARLSAGEVRNRAAGGAALLGARGVFIYAFGVVANIALARLLTPRDFGIFAIGMVVVTAGTVLAEGGLYGALIQRVEPPRSEELAAVTALQLSVTLAVAVGCALAAIPLGRNWELVALMATSLPITMVRSPSVVVLERRLQYRVLATADIVEALTFYAVAIGAVVAGLGVWGLAGAVVVRAAAGTAILLVRGPIGFVVPRWDWSNVRPLLAFGVKLQAASFLGIGREQLVNLGVAAVAGLGTLGVWALAWRIMQIPALLYQTVGRVAFPAFSRLLDAGRDPRPVLERQVPVLAAANGIVIVAVVGFAPALPELVGPDWDDVSEVIFWSGLALTISSPIVVTAAGYLLAAGMPGRIAWATGITGAVWLAVTLPLLGPLGPAAVGIGWLAGSLVNGPQLWLPAAARTGARLNVRIALAVAVAVVATVVGWFVAETLGASVLAGIGGILAGEALLFTGLLIVNRPALADLGELVRSGAGSLRGSTG